MSEFYYHFTQAIRSQATVIIGALASTVLLSSVPGDKPELTKVGLLFGAGLCSTVSLLQNRTHEENRQALEDFRISTNIGRQRSLLSFGVSSTKSETSEDSTPPLFDFADIENDRDSFPNVFVIGSPGSGKTSAVEYLGIKLATGKRYAVHPHAKPSDFVGFDRIFGGGRNIGTPDDEPVSWELIENGEVVPTVAQVIMGLYTLMESRYQQYYTGNTSFVHIDVYFDELPAITANLGKKFMSEYLPALIMECRKVGIRLWFLTQAFQVKALGLEGISDLREGATIVRLGKLAVKECERMVRSRRVDESVLRWMRAQARPVLVDDVPAKLPRFTEMKSAIAAYARSIVNGNVQTNDSVQIVDKQTSPWSELNGLEPIIRAAFTKGDTPQLTRNILRKLRDDQSEHSDLAHLLVHDIASKQGQSTSTIVKQYWGFQGRTEVYHEGLELAERLGLRS